MECLGLGPFHRHFSLLSSKGYWKYEEGSIAFRLSVQSWFRAFSLDKVFLCLLSLIYGDYK